MQIPGFIDRVRTGTQKLLAENISQNHKVYLNRWCANADINCDIQADDGTVDAGKLRNLNGILWNLGEVVENVKNTTQNDTAAQIAITLLQNIHTTREWISGTLENC